MMASWAAGRHSSPRFLHAQRRETRFTRLSQEVLAQALLLVLLQLCATRGPRERFCKGR